MYEVESLLEAEPIDKQRLKVIADSLHQKLELVKSLNKEVIKTCNVEEIVQEIEDADEINSWVMEMLWKVNNATSRNKPTKEFWHWLEIKAKKIRPLFHYL